MIPLLDTTDRRIRRSQNLAIFGSTALILASGLVLLPTLVSGGEVSLALAGASLAGFLGGLVGLVLSGSIRQRWEVSWRGHAIAFENSPLTGERLYLDGGLVARGGVGKLIELRAPIRVGEGAGGQVMALSDAGLAHLRARIWVDGVPEMPVVASSSLPGTPEAPPVEPTPHEAAIPVTTAPATVLHGEAPVAPAATEARHVGVLGGLVLARRVIEFVGSLITVVTTGSALLLWFL